jgi:hypothetical protein
MQQSSSRTDGVALQVHLATSFSAARPSLRAARHGLATALEAFPRDPEQMAPTISLAVPAPGGPFWLVNGLGPGDPSPRALARQLSERIAATGLSGAEVTVVEPLGRLTGLDTAPGAAILRAFPSPAGPDGEVPALWLRLAHKWVGHEHPEGHPLTARISGVEFAITPRAAVAVLQDCLRSRTFCDVVLGDPSSWVRVASLAFDPLPHLVIASGGPAGGTPELLRAVEQLRTLAHDLPDGVAYACIDIEADFANMAAGLTDPSWRVTGGAPPNGVAAWLVDEFVPGSYPYQVLGPPHQARLGAITTSAELLNGGRLGFTIGDPGAWLPGAPTRAWQQADGRLRLEACLVDHASFDNLVAARVGKLDGSSRPRPRSTPKGAGRMIESSSERRQSLAPDLDRVVLEAGPHRSRGDRLSILELVSWLDGQPHSDEPARVSPCAAAFVGQWAADLDPTSRQRLIPRAPSLVGSAGDGSLESERRWAVAEWLAYDQAPAWLRLAGLTDVADLLDQLGPLDDEAELLQAVTLLGRAALLGDERGAFTIDLAVSGLDGRFREGASAYLQRAAAGAWEQVRGPVGWRAACRAATHDIPTVMVDATNSLIAARVADPLFRHHASVDPNTLAERAWSAALHAVGNEVWNQGWAAVDALTTTLSNLDISGARKALHERVDDGQLTAATNRARFAARDVLVRAALFADPDDRGHAWDDAVAHAREVPGTEAWVAVTDATRAGVGEWTWSAAMDAARSAIAEPLHSLPRLVGRTTLVAVAGEACAAAARATAAGGAAVALTEGASLDVVRQAAVEALSGTGAQLTSGALTLFDQLVGLVVIDDTVRMPERVAEPA